MSDCQHPRIIGRVAEYMCRDCKRLWPRTGHGIEPGPGTRLYEKLHGYGLPPCDECRVRAFAMDLWGDEGCRRQLRTIAQWLKWEAVRITASANSDAVVLNWLQREGILNDATTTNHRQ